MFSPARCFLQGCDSFSPFGRTRLPDNLHGFNKRASNKYEEPVKVLFLGCGDISNALYTASKTAPESHLEIHVNDRQPAVITRNILLLYIISKPCFSLNSIDDAEYLWDVWYNALWPETTAKRFLCDIRELLEKKLPSNVKIADSSDWGKVSFVLHEWEKILQEMTVDEVVQIREKFMMDRFTTLALSMGFDRENTKNTKLEDFAHTIAKIIVGKLSLEELSIDIRESIHQEIANYFLTGVCWCPLKDGHVSVNPTLLDAITRQWRANTTDCPFNGYLPLEKDELNWAHQKGIMRQTCLGILKKSVAKYRERMAKTEIYLNIGDALEFCLSDSPTKFDMIDSSILADCRGLANIMISCNRRLSEQPGSRVFITSTLWSFGEHSSWSDYLEDGLCCPVSMAPTFYGLRLMNQAELGIPYPPYAKDEAHHYSRFCFEKTAPFENITLGLSEAFQDFTRKLVKKCFTNFIRSDCNVDTQCCSPLTFAYIMTNLKCRLESRGGGVKVMPFPEDPEKLFYLGRRATTDWSLGKPIKLFTLKTKPLLPFAEIIKVSPFEQYFLRVALLPPSRIFGSKSMLCDRIQDPGVHFIDNVRCDVTWYSKGGIKSIEFSFILPEEHKLPPGYTGALMDVRGQPVVKFDSLDVFKVETLKAPYPFRAEESAEMSQPKILTVECCTETVDSYTLHIKGQSNFKFPTTKLRVTSNRKAPCRSAHTLNVSFDGIEEMEPLRLTFPIPILVDKADICFNEQTIGLFLPKATLELWPSDYEDKAPKMNPDALPPWKSVEGNNQTQLNTHLDAQFADNAPKFDLQRPLVAALHNVRMRIELLLRGSSGGCEFFTFCLSNASGKMKELFFVRVRLPIRQSPSGAPMLLLTVLDLKESKRLKKQGRLTEAQLENAKKMLGSERARISIDVCSKYERNLWSYIFKLNSLKIMPSQLQSANLIANSSVMATFVSPLYTETPSSRFHPSASAGIPSFQDFFEQLPSRRSCANCGKQGRELKRCAKCKKVLYCSADCQRKNWPEHRTICVARD